MYEEQVPIPPLAMVDDLLVIALCNSTHSLNASIKTDTFIQRKKLEGQVGDGKCQWVHHGKGDCPATYKMNGESITKADSYKYLGDYIDNLVRTLYEKKWKNGHVIQQQHLYHATYKTFKNISSNDN